MSAKENAAAITAASDRARPGSRGRGESRSKMDKVVIDDKIAVYQHLNEKRLAPILQQKFDDVVSDSAQYGRIQFWDDRYLNDHEPFEWYYDYEYFRDTVNDYVYLDTKTIIAGCGNSNMPGDMALDGYTNIVCADISRVVVDQLKYRYRGIEHIKFFQGTMLDTNFTEGSFGAIIDKALFDSLLCSQTGPIACAQYILEVERLLSDTGVFILISYGSPEQRLSYLEQYDIDEPFYTPWMIEVQALAKPRELEGLDLDQTDPDSLYFVYICKKNKDMVKKKKLKEGRIEVKKKKAQNPLRKSAPNLMSGKGL